MQKRESFYAELNELTSQGWLPAPREYSSLTTCNNMVYLIGGQNYDCNKEVAQLSVGADHNHSEWNNMEYKTNDDKL